MTSTDPTTPVLADPDDPDALREQIEQTRHELGETVSALSDKTDVKAQATAKADEVKEKVHEVEALAKEKVREVETRAKQNPVPVAIGAIAVLYLLNRLRKRRRANRVERRRLESALQRTLAGGVPVAAMLVDSERVAEAA